MCDNHHCTDLRAKRRPIHKDADGTDRHVGGVWYATTAGEKQETRFNWHTKLSNLFKDGSLSEACGLTAATIAALLEIGWKPIRPDYWSIDENTTLKLDDQPFTRLHVIAKATNDL